MNEPLFGIAEDIVRQLPVGAVIVLAVVPHPNGVGTRIVADMAGAGRHLDSLVNRLPEITVHLKSVLQRGEAARAADPQGRAECRDQFLLRQHGQG